MQSPETAVSIVVLLPRCYPGHNPLTAATLVIRNQQVTRSSRVAGSNNINKQ